MFLYEDAILGWPVRLSPFSPFNKDFNRISILDRPTGQRANLIITSAFWSESQRSYWAQNERPESLLLAERTVGIETLLTVFAKPPVT